MKLSKKTRFIISWVLTVLSFVLAISFFPSFSSFTALVATLLLIPIRGIRIFIRKYLNKRIRLILIALLLVLTVLFAPKAATTNETPNIDNTPNIESSNTSQTSREEDVPFSESTEPSDPPHIHSFSPATCTAPQTCIDCGKTEGSRLEHSYSNGICTVCSQPDPTDPRNITVWIPTVSGSKYHTSSSCSGMNDPAQVTKAEAISRGFEPCGRCY